MLIISENADSIADFRLYADIAGFDSPTRLFKPRQQDTTSTGPQQNTLLHRARPDVAIEIRDELTVIKLTCPYGTNSVKSRKYKETQYEKIENELLKPTSNFKLIFLEITSLGFVTENIKPFKNFLKPIGMNEKYVVELLQEVFT